MFGWLRGRPVLASLREAREGVMILNVVPIGEVSLSLFFFFSCCLGELVHSRVENSSWASNPEISV